MSDSIWIYALAGGVLIGASATLLLIMNGKIAGVSGIVGGALERGTTDRLWRLVFVVGMIAGGALGFAWWPERSQVQIDASIPVLIVAGLLVGFGTRLGSGCTSGHGVCGLSRFSLRSLIATLIFIGAGMLTVYITQHGLA